MDLDSYPQPESELISFVKQIIYLVSSIPVSEPDYELKSLVSQTISLIRTLDSDPDPNQEPVTELMTLISQILYYLPSSKLNSELRSCIERLISLVEVSISTDLDLEPEQKLISLISKLCECERSELIILIRQVISLVMSLDLNSKPESKFMLLVSQAVSLFNSMDLDSRPKPLSDFISLISQTSGTPSVRKVASLMIDILDLEWEPKLMSIIHQIISLAISMDPKWQKRISLCPRLYATVEQGKFHVTPEQIVEGSNERRDCLPVYWEKYNLTGGNNTHFQCLGCNGENHGTYEKAPVEIKHPLHPKHSLQLVLVSEFFGEERKCYCCGEDLEHIFYCCSICDYVMNVACVDKPPVLSINLPKRHEHNLVHFPRQASLICDLCALPDSTSPFYICLLCDFVVQQSCASLPYVIRISRHPHRISFTPSFDHGNWSCGVCRREINNNYGGYSCIKAGCSYAAHSKCATQINVWDGIELEGVSEEIEEEEEPFVRISDGIIQHFSHEHHHLKLDENAGRDYDENKQCQACVTPIYYGNYYSCMQCEFILHETCANLSRRMYHPIHSHQLTLMRRHESLIIMRSRDNDEDESLCSACPRLCISGFFYQCGKEGCRFKLHVQCASLHEPLVHGSHMHPLFLTSKPGERRICEVCKCARYDSPETFNCIECDFAICFKCATLPQKVSYKHDKHMLTLSYGKETDTMPYWCEVCEREINQRELFYICDEYCSVTLHIKCLIGKDLYMKPGASWLNNSRKVDVLLNNRHMTQPFCSYCEKRCPYNVAFLRSGVIFCSTSCVSYNMLNKYTCCVKKQFI